MKASGAASVNKGQSTSDHLVQAAFHLFVNQGYHGTSMRQLARAAGLTPASIYNHFDSKEAIFREVLNRYHPYREIMTKVALAEGDSTETLVKNTAQLVISTLRSRRYLQHLLFIELVEFNGSHTSEMFARILPAVQEFFSKLQKTKGTLRPIPPESLMLTLMGMLMSQWILEGLFAGIKGLPIKPDHFETAIDIYLHGILKHKERSP